MMKQFTERKPLANTEKYTTRCKKPVTVLRLGITRDLFVIQNSFIAPSIAMEDIARNK